MYVINSLFWDVTCCMLVSIYRRLGTSCQGWVFFVCFTFDGANGRLSQKVGEQIPRRELSLPRIATGSMEVMLTTIHARRSGWLMRYSDLLWDGRSRDRIPVWLRFSAPVETEPETHPASYTMGTGSFLGVKRPGRGVEHPPHLAPRLKKV